MKRTIAFGIAGALALSASSASAEVLDFHLTNVENNDGNVTTDLSVDISNDSNALAQQLFIELSSGEIIFDASNAVAPFPPINGVSDLTNDTFVGIGGRTNSEQGTYGSLAQSGGAIDIMTDDEVNEHGSNAIIGGQSDVFSLTWNPSAGTDIVGENGLFLGRITLSDDAEGVWRLNSFSSGDGNLQLWDDETYQISGGSLVPEPGSLALLGAGAGLMLMRRRK